MARLNQAAMYRRTIRNLKVVTGLALIVAVIAALASVYILTSQKPVYVNQTVNTTPTQPFGERLTGINTPLNASALAIINNASDTYFEQAGEMFLNGTLKNEVILGSKNVTAYEPNGKPVVLYLGSITCIFCGENRWAMALALAKFGQFNALYNGYSSFGDADVPTLYFLKVNYNTTGIQLGNSYTSNYINFFTFEDTAPIMDDFYLQPLSTIQAEVNATANQSYAKAFAYIMSLQSTNATAFQGTPYTIWGNSLFSGADAIIFGNATPTTSVIPLTYMTHAQVLSQIKNANDQFGLSEYAAADVYISKICRSLNNTAPICQLPVIRRLEAL